MWRSRLPMLPRADAFEVAGRGELQLAILIETMRREGFELCVGRPRVVMQTDEATGNRSSRWKKSPSMSMKSHSAVVKKAVRAPRRTDRHASIGRRPPAAGVPCPDPRPDRLSRRAFVGYPRHRDHEPHVPCLCALWGSIPARRTGVLISNSDGDAVAYALWNLEDRGPMFISPGTKVYHGMVVGEHTRGNDLEVNVMKGKKLSNVRASGKDDAVTLTTPINLTLEKALAFITDDELVEVTPASIRLRKALLDPHARKRAERLKAEVA